jgi:hypothetical protein
MSRKRPVRFGEGRLETYFEKKQRAGRLLYSTAYGAGHANRAEHNRRVVPPEPIATDLSLRSPIAPRSVSHSQGSAVPPPGFLNTDWRSGFADSNPQWLGVSSAPSSLILAIREEVAAHSEGKEPAPVPTHRNVRNTLGSRASGYDSNPVESSGGRPPHGCRRS